MQANYSRKIIHVDMDAFYASVEQRDDPSLRGKPIAVGGGGARGVVTTASYEARKFGVHSAMSGFRARQLCPQLIFVPTRFDVYREVSQQVRAIFERYTDLIEPLSLDEAYLDVTENNIGEPLASVVAQQIMDAVYAEVQITCSAGVSYCKFLAKIASDLKKPNGITTITPRRAEAFLEQLPVECFHGVGKVTAEKMKSQGWRTGGDLKKCSQIQLAEHFGKAGRFYYYIVRGIDNRPVNNKRIRKSIGVERTLRDNLSTYDQITPVLDTIITTFWERLLKNDNFGRTLTLKLKTSDFQSLTRSVSKEHYLDNQKEIRALAYQLLEENIGEFEEIRLIGLAASNLQKQALESGLGTQLKFDFD